MLNNAYKKNSGINPAFNFSNYRSLSFSLKLGTDGVAYSSMTQAFLTFLVSFIMALISIGMRPWHFFKITLKEYAWMIVCGSACVCQCLSVWTCVLYMNSCTYVCKHTYIGVCMHVLRTADEPQLAGFL